MAHSNLQAIRDKMQPNHASVGTLPNPNRKTKPRAAIGDSDSNKAALVSSSEQTIKQAKQNILQQLPQLDLDRIDEGTSNVQSSANQLKEKSKIIVDLSCPGTAQNTSNMNG